MQGVDLLGFWGSSEGKEIGGVAEERGLEGGEEEALGGGKEGLVGYGWE